MNTHDLYIVSVSFVDLRREPLLPAGQFEKDPLQESQLLFGELVAVAEVKEGWAYIEALEQPRFSQKQGWTGYPGWVLKEFLSPVPHPPSSNLIVRAPWANIEIESEGSLKVCMGTCLEGVLECGDLSPLCKTSTCRGQNFDLDHLYSENLRSAENLECGDLSPLCKTPTCRGQKDLEHRFLERKGDQGRHDYWDVRLPDNRIGKVLKEHVKERNLEKELTRQVRESILNLGASLLGHPYLWGGRTIYNHGVRTSCDCSGLVNLLYRVHGFELPRDAHDQYLRCEPVEPNNLEIGDLIFLSSREKPDRMHHVMLYGGEDGILETNITMKQVLKTTFHKRFGQPLTKLSNGCLIGNDFIHFGNPGSRFSACGP